MNIKSSTIREEIVSQTNRNYQILAWFGSDKRIESFFKIPYYWNILSIIQKMFNLETDDLALKPYIPQKKYFYEFVANILRDNIGILIFDLHGGC